MGEGHQHGMIEGHESDDLVNAGDVFSNESSFHGVSVYEITECSNIATGEESTKAELEVRVKDYNPKYYWDIVNWNIQCLAAKGTSNQLRGTKRKRQAATRSAAGDIAGVSRDDHVSATQLKEGLPSLAKILYNPFEGEQSAKQLSETLRDFLSRLPPSMTSSTSVGPWIWIANPHSSYRPASEDIAGFKQKGTSALEEYICCKEELKQKNPGKSEIGIARMLKPKRDALWAQILDLARQHRVTSGKWMLFESPEHIDMVWSKVAKAVLENKLGCSAKVATSGGDKTDKHHLLCIYTVDFSDVDDINRVLKEIVRLELLKNDDERSKTIYYKCDAYTHLDIVNGNKYKLKASMYNSTDLLSEMST